MEEITMFNMKLTADEKAKLKRLAEREYRSMTGYIRHLIERETLKLQEKTQARG